MKINLIKILLFLVFLSVFLDIPSNQAYAQVNSADCSQSPWLEACGDAYCSSNTSDLRCSWYVNKSTGIECNNPFSEEYTTAKCAEIRLGLSEIETGTIIVPRDPNSLIVVFFRILLAIVILITVGRIVIIGIQIAGLGDDADKRKELFVQLIYTLTGLVIGLSALGITFLVQNIIFGRTFDDQVFQCSDLPTNASQELKDKCSQYLNVTPTP